MAFDCSLKSFLPLMLVLASCAAVFSDDSCGDTSKLIREKGRCMWFGACKNDTTYVAGGKLNCLDNTPARRVSSLGEKFGQKLKDLCPHYYDGGNGMVCCDYSMIDVLTEQLKYPEQLFSRCPACLRNFIDHFCATTCDPDQSLFMNPTECVTGDIKKDGKNTTAMKNVELYITKEYAEGLYSSCSQVQYPQASNRVVDIMCGGTDTCNSTLWLNYLGDPTLNHNSPFMMKYRYGKNGTNNIVPREHDFTPCNTNDTSLRCSCADCGTDDLCPASPQAPKNHFPQSTVFYSIVGIGMFLSLVVFGVAMVLGVVWSLMGSRTGQGGGAPPGQGGYGAVDNDSPTSSVGSLNADDAPLVEVAPSRPRFNLCMPCYTFGAHLENMIKIVFYHWGVIVARFWPIVVMVGFGAVVFIVGLTAILHFTHVLPFTITTDPVQLWSAPDSRARLEKDYFDKNFNPFYRTEMMIFTAKEPIYTTFQPVGQYGVSNWTFGPVFTNDVLHEVYHIQDYLINMVANGTLSNGTEVEVTLEDICYKPLSPDNTNCTIMSVLNYFQNDLSRLDYTEDFGLINNSYHIYYCTRDPTAPAGSFYENVEYPCLGAFGGPVDPNVALGGFNHLPNGSPNYNNATALIVTFTVNNHVNDEDNEMAKIWEKAFLDYLHAPNLTHVTNLTYMAERSVEDELARESKTDVYTVLLSYVFMFGYITLFLGHIRKPITIFIDMKVSVGFVGVLIVLFAVLSSLCFLNLARVTATLIIIEVVPFLVLAVGVDNLFIIVHSYERQVAKFAEARDGNTNGACPRELIGRAIAEVAPSLLLTSLSETMAFLLGAISTIPAVRTFSLYAGVAVFFNFLLQISLFLAALSVDARRQLANRFDVLCCLKPLKGVFDPRKGLSIMKMIMNAFATLILHRLVRPFVLLFFGVTSTLSLAFMFRLDIGLDQTLALPKDSYLEPYFSDLYEYLPTGSPVYFVIKPGFNYSDPEFQAKFCSAAGCDKHSIGAELFGYSRNSELTGIAEPGMLWLDTYFEWIAPSSKCCGINEEGDFCLTPQYENSTCNNCVSKLNENGWPYPEDFGKYLPWFLKDNPGTRCPSGGHAAFAGGVKLNNDSTVNTSYVMTLHTNMSTSESFISNLKWARKLGDKLTNYTGVEIFPYSVFYVYYEQYLTTVQDMALNIGVSIGAVFLVTFVMMGLNVWAAVIVMLIVCMIIVHMLGCMALASINANAVSLVNLVMTVGIAVEFCSHIVRWFCSCSAPTRVERAHSALANMGESVVSGITITKLIGVFVLFFAKSQIFEIYYFRMYMFMLLWGALHGLVFLPVLLSYIGPPYVHIDVRPPYSDFVSKAPPTPGPRVVTSNDPVPSAPSNIPVNSQPSKNASQNAQYPSLPNVGDYHTPAPAGYQGSEQQYPQPTYPGQQQYQRAGEVYVQSDERSKLLQ